jgi:hypothetical protein
MSVQIVMFQLKTSIIELRSLRPHAIHVQSKAAFVGSVKAFAEGNTPSNSN